MIWQHAQVLPAKSWTVLSDICHLHECSREHPQCVDGTQRNPGKGSHGKDPVDPLSPSREDIVLIVGWCDLDDGENQDNLCQEETFTGKIN